MALNGESRRDSENAVSIRTAAGVVVVLLAAVGIGMGIREFRSRSSVEKRVAEAPKAVEPADAAETRYVQEPLPIEEAPVEPEEPAPEPVMAAPKAGGGVEQGETEVQEAPAAEPVEEDPKVKEKRGREALGMIGYDPAADDVWISVINDPSVSANARSNLIEDLNEDGFSDPRNLTFRDLPVIEYRIGLIDKLSPYAMDQTNADAFEEARKDLVNMANRVMRQ